MVKLSVKELKKEFDGKETLSNVSFDVNDGEFLSILGPSGCGKTTILRILTGLLKPDSGHVYKDNIDITDFHPSKRGMGIVFQNYALFENMTVRENIEYAAKVKVNKDKRKYAEISARADSLLELLGISPYQNKLPVELSGGQQQRTAIARTLIMNPDIILFDEPMSALDAASRLSLRAELKTIQQKFGTTMIYITHDQEEAFALSDRIMVMDNGRIVQLDKPEVILKSPKNEYVENFVLHNLKLKFLSLQKYAMLVINHEEH